MCIVAGLKIRFNNYWRDTRCPVRRPPCFHSCRPVCWVNPVLAGHSIHYSGFPYFELLPTFWLSSTSRHLQLLQPRLRQLQSLHPSTSATAIQPIGERRCSFFSRSYCTLLCISYHIISEYLLGRPSSVAQGRLCYSN